MKLGGSMKIEYPCKTYANVLLLDNMIVNWKVGKTHWNTVDRAFCNTQFLWVIKKANSDALEVKSKEFICATKEERINVFEERAEKFMKQWKIHPKFTGFDPY